MTPAAQNFEPFTLEEDGIRLRVARFEGKGRVCLLLNGQTEFIEKYFEVIDELRSRGFQVVTFDWRGQGGSSRLLPDRRKVHIDDFSAYDRDLDLVIQKAVRPVAGKTRPMALAHSMGGNILLRRLHDVRDEFSLAVLCAPMLAIKPRGMPWWLVEKIAAFFNRNASSKEFVWGMRERDQLKLPFALQIVTSDPKRYARTHALLAANPELRLNGPTWGWLGAALHAMARLQASGYAEAIQTPSLLVGAGHDRVCDMEAVVRFAARMPHGQFLEVPGAEHEILMERDSFRDRFWSGFDRFVGQQGLLAAPERPS